LGTGESSRQRRITKTLPCSFLDRLRVVSGRKVKARIGARGQWRVALDDAQRYRTNAAECLSAAERCDPAHRDLTLAIAASWLSLARQQEAMDQLLAILSQAVTVTLADPGPRRFQYPRDLRRPPSSASTGYRQSVLPTLRMRLARELFAAARSPGAASEKSES
jgi:hypothetical protein